MDARDKAEIQPHLKGPESLQIEGGGGGGRVQRGVCVLVLRQGCKAVGGYCCNARGARRWESAGELPRVLAAGGCRCGARGAERWEGAAAVLGVQGCRRLLVRCKGCRAVGGRELVQRKGGRAVGGCW